MNTLAFLMLCLQNDSPAVRKEPSL